MAEGGENYTEVFDITRDDTSKDTATKKSKKKSSVRRSVKQLPAVILNKTEVSGTKQTWFRLFFVSGHQNWLGVLPNGSLSSSPDSPLGPAFWLSGAFVR